MSRAMVDTACRAVGVLLVLAWLPAFVAAQADPRTRVLDTARHLVSEGSIRLTGRISCALESGEAVTPGGRSDAQALVEVASRPAIFLFVTGFSVDQMNRGPRTSADARSYWRAHLALVRALNPSHAACVLAPDTVEGFGPHQPQFGDFLFALRWLTDDPALADPARRIVLVAHSAGGIFVKDAFLAFRRHLAASGAPSSGRAPTPMRIVFLGTPHRGADVADLARAALTLGAAIQLLVRDTDPRTYDAHFRNRMREREAGTMQWFADSRGVTQLRPDSDALRALHEAFVQARTPNVQVLGLYGDDDAVVPARSSAHGPWPTLGLAGVTHEALLMPTVTDWFLDVMTRIYR